MLALKSSDLDTLARELSLGLFILTGNSSTESDIFLLSAAMVGGLVDDMIESRFWSSAVDDPLLSGTGQAGITGSTAVVCEPPGLESPNVLRVQTTQSHQCLATFNDLYFDILLLYRLRQRHIRSRLVLSYMPLASCSEFTVIFTWSWPVVEL